MVPEREGRRVCVLKRAPLPDRYSRYALGAEQARQKKGPPPRCCPTVPAVTKREFTLERKGEPERDGDT